LFADLGLDESLKKAEEPTHQMVYLGVMFDSVAMEMRVPPEKLAEIKAEIKLWTKKTTITKKNLQSLLGKLFWVAKVVKFARIFMGRLLQQSVLWATPMIPSRSSSPTNQERTLSGGRDIWSISMGFNS